MREMEIPVDDIVCCFGEGFYPRDVVSAVYAIRQRGWLDG